MKKIINYSVLVFILAALGIGGYFYWLHEQRYPSTDDAYIQANVINVASQVNGKVAKIFASNQQYVKKNQMLFTIEPKPFEISYKKAVANFDKTLQAIKANQEAVAAANALVKQREAELTNAAKNYSRILPLVKKGYYAKSAGDKTTQQLSVAKEALAAARSNKQEALAKLGKTGDANADIQAAKENIAQAIVNLKYTKIVAPADGHLAKFNIQPGQTVTAYQPVFSLVENKSWWVIANMKETALERIHVGQKVIVHVDMYPSHPFHGTVSSISPGSGASFALLPPENASGNWVKVDQRFPVKITIQNPNPQYPLRIGASCSVSIDTVS